METARILDGENMSSRLWQAHDAYFVSPRDISDIKALITSMENAKEPLTIYMDGVLYKFPTLEVMDLFCSALELFCSIEGK